MNTETQVPGCNSIGQIGVMVEDLQQATEFYRDKLGMRHLVTAGGMAFFSLGNIRLMLGQRQPGDASGTILYYRVDDIHSAFATFKSRGVTMVEEPELAHRSGDTELWLAFMKDMEGNTFGLMSEIPRSHDA